jgi:hypothetical protein
VANRGNDTIVRMGQNGRAVAIRRVTVANRPLKQLKLKWHCHLDRRQDDLSDDHRPKPYEWRRRCASGVLIEGGKRQRNAQQKINSVTAGAKRFFDLLGVFSRNCLCWQRTVPRLTAGGGQRRFRAGGAEYPCVLRLRNHTYVVGCSTAQVRRLVPCKNPAKKAPRLDPWSAPSYLYVRRNGEHVHRVGNVL